MKASISKSKQFFSFIIKCDTVTAVTMSQFQKLFLLIFWCHKSINNVSRLLCDTCHKSRWFMALENEPIVIIEDGTVWQLSHCHTLFAYKCWVCTQKNQPTVPKCVCINPSTPHGESKTKNGTLSRRFGHFTRLTKNAKNAIFQFLTWFLKTFPST